jgi:hypothetical protein
MSELTKEAIELLIQAGEERIPGYLCTDDRTEILVLREPNGGQKYINLETEKDARRDHPRRIKTTVRFVEPASFVKYWTDFVDLPQAALFGSFTPEAILFLAIFDYHRRGEVAPGWCAHRAELQLAATTEWLDWQKRNGRDAAMSPEQFSNFIEMHAVDFVDPVFDKMLAIAETLHVEQVVSYAAKGRTKDGRVQFTASEISKDGVATETTFEVPTKFTISVEAFFGCGKVALTAYLRYQLSGGKLVFWYELIRPHRVRKVMFDTIREDIERETSSMVLMGNIL